MLHARTRTHTQLRFSGLLTKAEKRPPTYTVSPSQCLRGSWTEIGPLSWFHGFHNLFINMLLRIWIKDVLFVFGVSVRREPVWWPLTTRSNRQWWVVVVCVLSSLCVCVYRHCVCVPLAQPLDAMNMMDSVLCNHIMYDSYIVSTLSDIFFLSCIIGSLSLAF